MTLEVRVREGHHALLALAVPSGVLLYDGGVDKEEDVGHQQDILG